MRKFSTTMSATDYKQQRSLGSCQQELFDPICFILRCIKLCENHRALRVLKKMKHDVRAFFITNLTKGWCLIWDSIRRLWKNAKSSSCSGVEINPSWVYILLDELHWSWYEHSSNLMEVYLQELYSKGAHILWTTHMISKKEDSRSANRLYNILRKGKFVALRWNF